MKRIKRIFSQKYILAKLLLHIFLNCGSERFMQYLSNRGPFTTGDPFFMHDEWILNHLKQKERELK